MALSKEDIAEILELVDARATARGDGKTELQKKRTAQTQKIKAAAHKTETHAHYVVGEQGAYRQGRRYQPGEVIKLPLDENPSHTWRPASSKGIAAAARAEALKADETADLVADMDEDEADVEPESDEPEAAPTPPAKPAAKKPTPPAKKSGKAGTRASDQDVA